MGEVVGCRANTRGIIGVVAQTLHLCIESTWRCRVCAAHGEQSVFCTDVRGCRTYERASGGCEQILDVGRRRGIRAAVGPNRDRVRGNRKSAAAGVHVATRLTIVATVSDN